MFDEDLLLSTLWFHGESLSEVFIIKPFPTAARLFALPNPENPMFPVSGEKKQVNKHNSHKTTFQNLHSSIIWE